MIATRRNEAGIKRKVRAAILYKSRPWIVSGKLRDIGPNNRRGDRRTEKEGERGKQEKNEKKGRLRWKERERVRAAVSTGAFIAADRRGTVADKNPRFSFNYLLHAPPCSVIHSIILLGYSPIDLLTSAVVYR